MTFFLCACTLIPRGKTCAARRKPLPRPRPFARYHRRRSGKRHPHRSWRGPSVPGRPPRRGQAWLGGTCLPPLVPSACPQQQQQQPCVFTRVHEISEMLAIGGGDVKGRWAASSANSGLALEGWRHKVSRRHPRATFLVKHLKNDRTITGRFRQNGDTKMTLPTRRTTKC